MTACCMVWGGELGRGCRLGKVPPPETPLMQQPHTSDSSTASLWARSNCRSALVTAATDWKKSPSAPPSFMLFDRSSMPHFSSSSLLLAPSSSSAASTPSADSTAVGVAASLSAALPKACCRSLAFAPTAIAGAAGGASKTRVLGGVSAMYRPPPSPGVAGPRRAAGDTADGVPNRAAPGEAAAPLGGRRGGGGRLAENSLSRAA
eukprot:scaffold3944_cov111-Isochrysis_galbana.AAC.6